MLTQQNKSFSKYVTTMNSKIGKGTLLWPTSRYHGTCVNSQFIWTLRPSVACSYHACTPLHYNGDLECPSNLAVAPPAVRDCTRGAKSSCNLVHNGENGWGVYFQRGKIKKFIQCFFVSVRCIAVRFITV